MEELLSDRWSHCKQTLQKSLGREDAAAWLSSLHLVYLGPEKAILGGVPNTFFRTRIQTRYRTLLKDCLAQAFPTVAFSETFAIEIQVGNSTPPAGQGTSPGGQSASPTGDGAPPLDAARSPTAPQRFDNFLVGPHNNAALDLARQAAQAPGERFNPFLLVGPLGTGKTHLLQAMAHALRQRSAGEPVIYCTAEAFANDVLDGIREKKMPAVRQKYRRAAGLVMDDLEFLLVSGKSQGELLHTFDALQAQGKQLVFSADRYPAAMAGLEPTLRSRLEGGLVADLALPGAEARLALVEALAVERTITLPPGAAGLLAARISGGPRKLEGALLRLSAYRSLHGQPITLDFVENVAAPFFDQDDGLQGQRVPQDRILAAVCDQFGVSMGALRGRGRTKKVTEARGFVCFLLREFGGFSFSEIGALLGNRDESMAFKARKRIQQRLRQDPVFENILAEIRRALVPG